jgi:hypothetical protein
MRLLDEDEKPDRRRRDLRPTIAISGSLLVLALTVVYYAGGADQRLKNVESSIVEIRGDVRELRDDVGHIEVRTAAMQRQRERGIIEEPIAAHETRSR